MAFPFQEMVWRLVFRGWDLVNRWTFGQRRRAFRPNEGLVIPSEPLEGLYPEGSPARSETERMKGAYGLDWPDERANMQENLHVVGLLETALAGRAADLPPELAVLDVGAKDWHYLPGLRRFLARVGTTEGRSLRLTGIELDPYYRYDDGYTRYDYARAYMRECPECEYVPGDVREHTGRYDLVLVLFPFWREREVLDWGLPGAYFDIDGLLGHARSLLAPGGLMLVSSFRSEAPWAEATFRRLNWEPIDQGEWRSPFVKASAARWWVFGA